MANVRGIFEAQLSELATADEVDVRALELPLARIKKIMKIEDEVECQLGGRRCMVSSEAPVLFAKACEIFVLELTERAWAVTQENKRRTLQRSDVCAAVSRSDMYDFLIDVVPRDEGPPPPQEPVVQDKRAWQQRLAEHIFYNHPLAHRLGGVPEQRFQRSYDRYDDDDDDDDMPRGGSLVLLDNDHHQQQPQQSRRRRRHVLDDGGDVVDDDDDDNDVGKPPVGTLYAAA
eukprot:CAMPEP_0198658060 /NCGR_PEP_ID=MMETSP1467-20131203/21983_1 /TAXON_ID=1462469 /ORGANISM="unid. sp., Strain CCMP2135" /LENGTH=230 /DNA_ID=CAMNT_0044394307 /DNA_START=18 /DNA_END=710 /DNA_ORIENTATION=+